MSLRRLQPLRRVYGPGDARGSAHAVSAEQMPGGKKAAAKPEQQALVSKTPATSVCPLSVLRKRVSSVLQAAT